MFFVKLYDGSGKEELDEGRNVNSVHACAKRLLDILMYYVNADNWEMFQNKTLTSLQSILIEQNQSIILMREYDITRAFVYLAFSSIWK